MTTNQFVTQTKALIDDLKSVCVNKSDKTNTIRISYNKGVIKAVIKT
jgi:hypothetical protein